MKTESHKAHQKTPLPLLPGQDGLAILKVAIATLLLSFMLFMDLKRQKKNMLDLNRRRAAEARQNLVSDLQQWLGQDDTIFYSFGGGVTGSCGERARVYGPFSDGPLPRYAVRTGTGSREIASATADNFDITEICLHDEDTNTVRRVLSPICYDVNTETFANGPCGANTISFIRNETLGRNSLDLAGWTYIKAMWIDDFTDFAADANLSPPQPPPPITPPQFLGWNWQNGSTTPLPIDLNLPANQAEGDAILRVLIWTFNNRIDSPGLDCSSENNCSRITLDFPLDIKVISTPNSPLKGFVVSGKYGLKCGPLALVDRTLITDTTCASDELFQRIKGNKVGPDANNQFNTTHFLGRCCKLPEHADSIL
ncbi:MAG: hypothetical protein OXB88_10410 [Bacteriovoracales bacterium]|nr:hypothetical protein [Bacteriovoracales bacterium]